MSPTSTMGIHLEEAAHATKRSKHTLILLVQREGVKVWAPRYGRLEQEYLVTWAELETSIGNPLLPAIAKVEEALAK